MKRLFQTLLGQKKTQSSHCARCEALEKRLAKLEETNIVILKRLIQLGEPISLKSKPKTSAGKSKPAKLVILKKPKQEQQSDRLSLLDPHKEPTYH